MRSLQKHQVDQVCMYLSLAFVLLLNCMLVLVMLSVEDWRLMIANSRLALQGNIVQIQH